MGTAKSKVQTPQEREIAEVQQEKEKLDETIGKLYDKKAKELQLRKLLSELEQLHGLNQPVTRESIAKDLAKARQGVISQQGIPRQPGTPGARPAPAFGKQIQGVQQRELSPEEDISVAYQELEVGNPAQKFAALERIKQARPTTGMTFEQRMMLKRTSAATLDEQGIKDAIEAIKTNPSKLYDYSALAKNQLIPALHKAMVEVVPKGQIKSAADAAASAVSGITVINLAEENLGSLIGADTVPEAWAQYATRSLGSFFRSDADAAVYNSFIKGMIPLVARAVGHTGVLTQIDYDETLQLFPTFKDTIEIAQRKMGNIRKLIEGNKEARLKIFGTVGGGIKTEEKPKTDKTADPLGLF